MLSLKQKHMCVCAERRAIPLGLEPLWPVRAVRFRRQVCSTSFPVFVCRLGMPAGCRPHCSTGARVLGAEVFSPSPPCATRWPLVAVVKRHSLPFSPITTHKHCAIVYVYTYTVVPGIHMLCCLVCSAASYALVSPRSDDTQAFLKLKVSFVQLHGSFAEIWGGA